MLGAIRRVISGENMDTEGQQQQEQQQQPQIGDNSNPPNTSSSNNNNSMMMDPTSAIVENDDDDDNMDIEIDNNHQHQNNDDDHTIGSSISNVSSTDDNVGGQQNLFVPNDQPMVIMETQSQPRPPPSSSNRTANTVVSSLPKPQKIMNRTDSRNSSGADSYSSNGRQSSQNSSRDWGWFEETEHGGVGTPHTATSTTKKRSPLTKEEELHLLQEQQRQQQEASTKTMEDDDDDKGDNSAAPSSKKGSKKKKGKGTSLLPNLTMTSSDDMLMDETQQILLDPPTDLESEARAMAVTAPNYVLEESLSSQRLWKDTAGNRPPQPVEERAFFEKMWAQNFARSQVEYQMPVEVLTATTPISMSPFADGTFDTSARQISNYNVTAGGDGTSHHHPGGSAVAQQQDVAEATLVSRLNDPARGGHTTVSSSHHHNHEVVNRKIKGNNSEEDLTILIRGDNVFGTTVSKSFARPSGNGGISRVDTVNISIASYRVVESRKHGKYAQFLVIYREGSIRDTIGVWKRYSDFQRLSEKVTKAHEGCAAVIANMSPLAVTEEHDVEHLPNAITSWRLLKKRQRWYRCLDAGYLSLKVFLLERFLHDILFESSTPDLLRDFVNGD